MREIHATQREALADWLTTNLKRRGLTQNQLAHESGVPVSTINRIANQKAKTRPDPETLEALASFFGEDPPFISGSSVAAGRSFVSPEATRQAQSPRDAGNSIETWTLHTNVLEAAGYQPGDVLFVDVSANPADADLVCATIHNFKTGRVETVFRFYYALPVPILVASSLDPQHRRPILVDGERVRLHGVVRQMRRGTLT